MIESCSAARARRSTSWTKLLYAGVLAAVCTGSMARSADALDMLESRVTARRAWSGFWWPMLDTRGPHLYDYPGPLSKYGQWTGDYNPYYWEHYYHKTSDPKATWWGHCNGWAAAAVLEREPKYRVQAGTAIFEVGDVKGLLSEAHNSDPVDYFRGARLDRGATYQTDLRAWDFHIGVIYFMRNWSEALVFNISRLPQVWNYPTDEYHMTCKTDAVDPSITHVVMKLTFADDAVPPDYIGAQKFTKTYAYWVKGNPLDIYSVTAAGWEDRPDLGVYSVQDHPQFVWHPAYQKSSAPLNGSYVRMLGQASAGN